MSRLSRREVLLGGLAAAGAPPAASSAGGTAARTPHSPRPTLCLFSKPLPFLGYPELAKTLQGLGIPGVDLTTRPNGHVLPERVSEDLPTAVEALKNEGIKTSMITTGLVSVSDPAARPTLYTAAKLGVEYFKLGYYQYQDVSRLDERLDEVKRAVEGLAGVAQHAGIQGGFHNHSGAYVGSALWDHWWLMRDSDPRWMGFYFDPCHATIEGGHAGWKIGFHRVVSRLKMVATKDFYWEKRAGKWRVHMSPLGEGMVDYPAFFKMLAASGFSGPISLHVEYKIEAPTESARREKVLAAIERDYNYLRKIRDEAFA